MILTDDFTDWPADPQDAAAARSEAGYSWRDQTLSFNIGHYLLLLEMPCAALALPEIAFSDDGRIMQISEDGKAAPYEGALRDSIFILYLATMSTDRLAIGMIQSPLMHVRDALAWAIDQGWMANGPEVDEALRVAGQMLGDVMVSTGEITNAPESPGEPGADAAPPSAD